MVSTKLLYLLGLRAVTAFRALPPPPKLNTSRRLGYVMDDTSIRTAVSAWLEDAAAAEAAYGHISTWDTSGVRDMSYLFCGVSASDWASFGCKTVASSFNEDIGAWDTSGVTSMERTFFYAKAFNQDISGWAVDSFRFIDMNHMFYHAYDFDQDLGWCVDDGVELWNAFGYAACESTSCGVTQVEGGCAPSLAPTMTPAPTVTPRPTYTPMVADDDTIRTAVAAWLSDPTAAEATYGHISQWDTSGVTDMSWLFCVRQDYMEGDSNYDDCVLSTASFNEDISAWDTTDVTSMLFMFAGQWLFNQPLGDWSLDKIIDMRWMFYGVLAFDQDLGWCVIPYNGQSPPDGILSGAFVGTLCESMACGVVEDGCTGAPTTSAPTAFVTPPFTIGGNTTSTCIAPPDGAQRTPDGSGRCAASWLYERDREPWVPGATGCFDRANFGCQKCDGDAHPWCEAVDWVGEDYKHTGWCYCSDEDTDEESKGMTLHIEIDTTPTDQACIILHHDEGDEYGPITGDYRCATSWKFTEDLHHQLFGYESDDDLQTWQTLYGCGPRTLEGSVGNQENWPRDWCEAVDANGEYVGWCECEPAPSPAPSSSTSYSLTPAPAAGAIGSDGARKTTIHYLGAATLLFLAF